MSVLSIDFETRSAVDLKKAGVYRYAEDDSTDIWCMAYAFDNEEPEIWVPDRREAHGEITWNALPARVEQHIRAGGEIRAWNAQFERVIWAAIMVKRYRAPAVRLEQWVCSAAEAAAMALPRYLAGAAHVLKVAQQKDDKGYQEMLRMARPRKVNGDGTYTWWDVPDRLERLYEYCKQDVRTERALVPAMRRLTPREREIYLLDQRTNDRGILIDLQLVNAAQAIVDEGVTRANAKLDDLTNGDVTSVSHNRRLMDWLNDNDIEVTSVGKPALAALMERDDLAPDIVKVLKLRTEAGRSSVAKLKSLVYAACFDGAARGLLLYHGASTGRWTGKLIQPQNFPRGEVKNIESFIPAVLENDYDYIDLFYPPIVVVLSMLRSMLIARPGHELFAGDFSAIEARVLNWLAGQDDVVESFRMYDAAPAEEKPRHDPYRKMAVKMGRGKHAHLISFNDRQAGKAAELGCGFGMGWKKFIEAAWTVYQVRVTEEEAQEAVKIYRSSHSAVKQYWKDIEAACMAAVREPGTVFPFGPRKNVKATCRGAYLYIVLPSGRPLCYAAPSIEQRIPPWETREAKIEQWKKAGLSEQEILKRLETFEPETIEALCFYGVDPFTHQWGKLSAYGGLLAENITQAVARDLMAEGMLRVEVRGYLPLLSVHDEIVTEIPLGMGSVEDFEHLMSETPTWATGCPVAAEAWRGERYRK